MSINIRLEHPIGPTNSMSITAVHNSPKFHLASGHDLRIVSFRQITFTEYKYKFHQQKHHKLYYLPNSKSFHSPQLYMFCKASKKSPFKTVLGPPYISGPPPPPLGGRCSSRDGSWGRQRLQGPDFWGEVSFER